MSVSPGPAGLAALPLLLACALLVTPLPGTEAQAAGQLEAGPNAQHAFLDAPEASAYLSRRLRANNWDFELFQSDDLERECNEELCSFEEAREVFEDDGKTNAFWKKYTNQGAGGNSGLNIPGLLAGVIAAVVMLIFMGLVFAYCCKYRRKPRTATRTVDDMEMSGEPRAPHLDGGDPAMMMSPDQLLGLPSYDQAMEVSGQYDGPPPPYTGAPRTQDAVPGARGETSDLVPNNSRGNSRRGSRRSGARRDM